MCVYLYVSYSVTQIFTCTVSASYATWAHELLMHTHRRRERSFFYACKHRSLCFSPQTWYSDLMRKSHMHTRTREMGNERNWWGDLGAEEATWKLLISQRNLKLQQAKGAVRRWYFIGLFFFFSHFPFLGGEEWGVGKAGKVVFPSQLQQHHQLLIFI